MLAFKAYSVTKEKAPQSANSNGASIVCGGSSDADSFCILSSAEYFSRIKMCLPQLTVPEPKTVTPVGVFCRKDFPHLPMPLQVREYLSMRTILSLCGHKVGRGWFPDSLSRAIKSTGQVNTGGRVEPHADSLDCILWGHIGKGSYA